MGEFSLSVGAHLLLWGFPLGLILLVVINTVRDARRNRDVR